MFITIVSNVSFALNHFRCNVNVTLNIHEKKEVYSNRKATSAFCIRALVSAFSKRQVFSIAKNRNIFRYNKFFFRNFFLNILLLNKFQVLSFFSFNASWLWGNCITRNTVVIYVINQSSFFMIKLHYVIYSFSVSLFLSLMILNYL